MPGTHPGASSDGLGRSPATAGWAPSLGAWPENGGTRFRVWVPGAGRVDLIVECAGKPAREWSMSRSDDGTCDRWLAGVGAGARYRYRLDGGPPLPDPASRFQPDGVHGPSEIIDPRGYRWSDDGWTGVALEDAVFYELHVGTFSPEGSFDGVSARLPDLKDLGITIVELMPIADFPGERNWGYDGASLFAPARCYGRPDDLRRLVDRAHQLGLAVILDVVYNHLGPDGAYLWTVSPPFFSGRHPGRWGDGVNLDGPESALVRAFLIDNALHWIHEYHFDGLRLDATHALVDESPRHFLAELTERVHGACPGRRTLVVAEDNRNLATIVQRPDEGGWGLDAVWSDDFHHQVRRLIAGDADGYYADFRGTTEDLARTVRQGWFFCGQHSSYFGGPRGTDPSAVPPERFVVCLQNHDQVGNRALGERLHHQIDLATFRAATAVLLTVPQSPLLFMGQEWAASAPFLYFTDHHEELGRAVTEGRRQEFARFAAFADPSTRERIPDPQSPVTFERSRLDWSELQRDAHAATWRLHRRLLSLRRSDPALRERSRVACEVVPLDADSLLIVRMAGDGAAIAVVARLRGAGGVQLGRATLPRRRARRWDIILTTEDPKFCEDPQPVTIDLSGAAPHLVFARPGAVIMRTP